MQKQLITLLAASTISLGLAVQADAQTASAPAASTLPAGTAAIVNGVTIPTPQVDAVLRASKQPGTAQVRQIIKGELISREVFRQNAEKAHYDAKPEVQEAVNAAKVAAETQLYLKDNIHPEPVTDAQVKARYDQIVASLGKEEYKPRLIVVSDDATAATVISKLKQGSGFDALAHQYSVAPSKAAGGEMAWMSFKTPVTEGQTQGLPLAVAQAITQLPAGAVTPAPIPLGNARVIVKLDQKRPTQVPSFGQAQPTIRQQLQALAMAKASAAFIGPMIKAASIQQ
jgi:peptidyl-prolyl cis-trans isomerase C